MAFIPANRFQTDAVAKFGVIFFLWHIVSKVLHLRKITANFTGSTEATDFSASHQNFSIAEFIRNKGFYLDNSTLLDCDFFGKPCSPKVTIFYSSNIIKVISSFTTLFHIELPRHLLPWWINPNFLTDSISLAQPYDIGGMEYTWDKCPLSSS